MLRSTLIKILTSKRNSLEVFFRLSFKRIEYTKRNQDTFWKKKFRKAFWENVAFFSFCIIPYSQYLHQKEAPVFVFWLPWNLLSRSYLSTKAPLVLPCGRWIQSRRHGPAGPAFNCSPISDSPHVTEWKPFLKYDFKLWY